MAKTNEELEQEIKNLRARFKEVCNGQQRDIISLSGRVLQLEGIVEKLSQRLIELERRATTDNDEDLLNG